MTVDEKIQEPSEVTGVTIPVSEAELPTDTDQIASAEEDQNEPAVLGTLEDAQRLFEKGWDALRVDDYDQAAELFSRALEIRTKHYGELATECAFTYYKYGCALLYKAQSEADPLGEVKEPADAGDRAEADNEENDEDLEEEEEESDLDMAWKMLDIARVIYEKQQSHSIEEVDTITALADVSLEREDFDMCFRDYTRALEILEGLVSPDDRAIAELCFKLSLAHQLGYKPKEALRYCQQAVSVCEARLKRLRNELAIAKGTLDPKGKSIESEGAPTEPSESRDSEDSPFKKQEDEIKDIEQLLEDLREKVSELEGMASGPSLLESLNQVNPDAVKSIRQAFSVAAQFSACESQNQNASQEKTSSSGFEAPAMSGTAAQVTHLGVVGRGIKRATPVCVSTTVDGQEASTTKRRSLEDMMTTANTQIGFGSSSASDVSSVSKSENA